MVVCGGSQSVVGESAIMDLWKCSVNTMRERTFCDLNSWHSIRTQNCLCLKKSPQSLHFLLGNIAG